MSDTEARLGDLEAYPTAVEMQATSSCLQYLHRHPTATDADLAALLAQVMRLSGRIKSAKRASARAAAAGSQGPAPSGTEALPTPAVASAAEAEAVDVVPVPAMYLSRPLYANPVCLLATWARGRTNLMTISWLSPLDNDGRFTLSVNARRFTARMLAANPVLSLSVATAGMESTLRRVGSRSGRVVDKPNELGVLMCRPGWGRLESAELGSAAAMAEGSGGYGPTALETVGVGLYRRNAAGDPGSSEESGPELPGQVDASASDAGHEWLAWPDECEQHPIVRAVALDGAVAVAAGVAHLVARVDVARPRHGHFLIECQVIHAFVRREYWSGKTLEPQKPDLPPILTFFGSQRFGHVAYAI